MYSVNELKGYIKIAYYMMNLKLLQDQSFFEGCVKCYHHLVTSPKAVSCTAAAFLLKLLVHKKCKEFNNTLQIIVKEEHKGEYIVGIDLKTVIEVCIRGCCLLNT